MRAGPLARCLSRPRRQALQSLGLPSFRVFEAFFVFRVGVRLLQKVQAWFWGFSGLEF